MFGGQSLGQQVYELVVSWVPERAYRTEPRFRNDLQAYLEERLNRSNGGMFGGDQPHFLRRERGRSRADLAVDDRVGIELKREVTNRGLRRLRDQIHDYLGEYEYAIICACGLQETGKWNELRQEYEGTHGGGFGGDGTVVRFVEKRKEGRTFRGTQEERSGMFGGSAFNVDFGFDDDFGWG